jgi:uncharacterized protein YkwD
MDMAGLEGTRLPGISEAAREWRPVRYAPLYVAGIVAGLGIGFGVFTWPSSPPAVQPHRAAEAVVTGSGVIDAAPIVVGPSTGPNEPARIELPQEFQQAFGLLPVPPAPAPAVEPIAPAAPAPTAPQAAAPAAPAAPAPAPQASNPPAAAPAAAPAEKPNFYVPAVSSGPATAMELDLFSRINTERANAGLAPYVLDASLTKIARTRSQQMIDQNYFGHRDPYGYSMYVELLARFGYTSYAWAGENLAMNNWPADSAAAEAMNGLMNSPTHRANILAGDFFRVGIGEVTASDGRHFFTMIFLG